MFRQTSDDLTKFARMYVETGDDRFRCYFNKILEIRNGELPRPEHYDRAYWDLVLGEDASLPEMSEQGERLSFAVMWSLKSSGRLGETVSSKRRMSVC
ncbi:hypothetical protein DDZ13_11385 [Coraliomargarita sinensis]|uniref:Uncharacterized protein n=1 Tax=Coraliomargarita sinensis TaxID=2174842 RepID=A0A317ZE60_9BACT|nr:hypothetical protein DDZ13_11385 [Coraliomargarita sinensis]